MTWIESREEHGLVNIALALESEWDPKFEEVLWDFQKLLVSRARARVVIFQAPDDDANPHFDRLIEAISQYSGSQRGDRYLLFCWLYRTAPGRLAFKGHVVN